MDKTARNQAAFVPRRLAFLSDWRFSEYLLLGGIFSLGLIILAVHLATWGVEIRRDAKDWKSTECVVLDRELRSYHTPEGEIYYLPEIKFQYEVDGKTYKNFSFGRFDFDFSNLIYDRDEAAKILESYSVGSKTRCWVLVDDPSRASLVKKSTIWGWVFLIIPTSLILFGGIWLAARLRNDAYSKEALANARSQKTQYPTIPSVPPLEDSRGVVYARRLTSDVKSTFAFGASILGTCVWNLVSWFGVCVVLATAKTSADYWLGAGFSAIFCGIGALFACRLWGQYRVERVVGSASLEISQLPILPGRTVKVCLFLKGRVVAKRLDVFIQCEEIARYIQGTNSICHRRVVFSRSIFTKYDVNVPNGIEQREKFTTSLPFGVAPSFVAEHNEIVWKLVVKTEFADGGTFTRDFDVVVYPHVDLEH